MADQLYQHKSCTKCQEVKAFSEFAPLKNGLHGLRGACRVCYNKVRKAHYQKAHDKKLEIRREYESRPEVKKRRIELRSTPEQKARERISALRYKNKPDVVERIRTARAAYEVRPEIRARMVFAAAAARAKKRNIAFSLTIEWASEKIKNGVCEVTSLPFNFDRAGKTTRRNPFFPSIDQIEAGKGYTPENCRMVLIAVNLALAEWGLNQFLHIAKHALEVIGYEVAAR